MRIIVSMTSISSRERLVNYTLLSLTRQSLRADLIYLNLSKDKYLLDDGYNDSANNLADICPRGSIKINWVDNIGPYRKILPVIDKINEEDYLVICDDDVIYSTLWLETLISNARNNPDSIVCGLARKRRNILNLSISYIHWKYCEGLHSRKRVLPIGVGGVVYQKRFFSMTKLLDNEFKSIAPINDDLWFWQAAEGANTILVLDNGSTFFSPIDSKSSLNEQNLKLSDYYMFKVLFRVFGYFGISVVENDRALKRIEKYFS